MFSELRIEHINASDHGRQQFRLLHPLAFILDVNGGYFSVRVPRGFVTDFASVPRFLWPIFPPAGRWCSAAVVHDYLCSTGTCSRFLADAIFREAMAQLGVPLWKRCAMYYGVRGYAAVRALYRFLTPWVTR